MDQSVVEPVTVRDHIVYIEILYNFEWLYGKWTTLKVPRVKHETRDDHHVICLNQQQIDSCYNYCTVNLTGNTVKYDPYVLVLRLL